jgi:hypothetical protein
VDVSATGTILVHSHVDYSFMEHVDASQSHGSAESDCSLGEEEHLQISFNDYKSRQKKVMS